MLKLTRKFCGQMFTEHTVKFPNNALVRLGVPGPQATLEGRGCVQFFSLRADVLERPVSNLCIVPLDVRIPE